MKNIKSFRVNNMNCNHCVASITKALNQLEKVEDIKIDLKKKIVDVTGDIPSQEIMSCLSEAGYPAELL